MLLKTMALLRFQIFQERTTHLYIYNPNIYAQLKYTGYAKVQILLVPEHKRQLDKINSQAI
jgi:hypothetical protein